MKTHPLPNSINRRHFLATAAAALAAPSGRAAAAAGYIDAHVHVWTPDTVAYPVAEGFTQADLQPPSFTPEQLLAEAKPHGVDRIVLIQMSFYKTDNRYMLDSMARFPGVFSGVAIIDAEAADAVAQMKTLKAQGVRGFRLYTDKEKAESWQHSDSMKKMWAAGADENLAMCLLANPDALPAVHQMCEAFPKTPVVIDHFARLGMRGPAPEADLENLLRLAAFPTVHVKTSAFYALGQKKAPYTDLGPMIRRLRDAYGASRLMWATDCPYQVGEGHTYADSIALIRDRLDFLSPTDKNWMLRGTAEKLFFS
jgi:predicted TIM-barrel fold metal-dependent hydrolase